MKTQGNIDVAWGQHLRIAELFNGELQAMRDGRRLRLRLAVTRTLLLRLPRGSNRSRPCKFARDAWWWYAADD